MAATRNITQQIRFLLTAVTLFCVLLLNNQEITSYRLVASKSAAESSQQVQGTSKKQKTVVKQKVTFEATTSYFILQPVYFTRFLHPVLYVPATDIPELLLKPSYYIHFFSVLFGFIINPNAP